MFFVSRESICEKVRGVKCKDVKSTSVVGWKWRQKKTIMSGWQHRHVVRAAPKSVPLLSRLPSSITPLHLQNPFYKTPTHKGLLSFPSRTPLEICWNSVMGMVGRRFSLLLLVAVATLQLSFAAVYKVGDSAGWTTIGNVDYKKWASTKTFHVGDIIRKFFSLLPKKTGENRLNMIFVSFACWWVNA